jgi:outer membrane lipoprotein carrier protein
VGTDAIPFCRGIPEGRTGVMGNKPLLVLNLVGALLVSQPPGIVDRIQAFYEAASDVRGHFAQRVELAMGNVEEARGTFFLKRPGMMRWEYEHPERRLLVTDGVTLWAYTPADRQVIVQELKAAVTPLPFDFLVGAGKLTEQFVVQQSTAAGDCYRLVLVPRRPDPHLAEMEMVVTGTSLHVRSLTLRDPYQNRTAIRFSRLQVNSDLPSDVFSFVPPPGVKILRAEELYPR